MLTQHKAIIIGLLICTLPFFSGSAQAVDKKEINRLSPARFSMVGLRIGAWVAQGGDVNELNVTAEFPDASFYTEIYYDHRFTPAIIGEISLGVSTRGDATYLDGDNKYVGTINLYPMLLQLKISPLAGGLSGFRPYLIGGGGVVVGKQSTDIVIGPSLPLYLNEESQTDLLVVLGGGIDIPLSEQLGLNINGKYHWIDFGDNLAGLTDYSGMAISVGVAYFLHKK